MKAIEIRELSKSFGGVRALSDVSFDVPFGAIVGIVGENGAGKTTLLNILAGTVSQDTGTLKILGMNVTGWPASKVFRLGVVRSFQEGRLLKRMSVLENLILSGSRNRWEGLYGALIGRKRWRSALNDSIERGARALSTVGLTGKENCAVNELSIGEQRLLSFCCSLVSDSRLLLLDEPFASLAPGRAQTVANGIRSYREAGGTVVMVEHSLERVRELCDGVILLKSGSIASNCETEEFFSS